MIGYICKYTPVELLKALGMEPVLIEANATSFNESDALMHPNVCSYAKSVLEDFTRKDYDGIVLTSCCDSIRRLYDVLKKEYPEKEIYMLDLPRRTGEDAVSFYEKELEKLIAATGRTYDEKKLLEFMGCVPKERQSKGQLSVGIMGGRYSPAVRNLLGDNNVSIAFDMTCLDIKRKFSLERNGSETLLHHYASELLHFVPCMRMADTRAREDLLKSYEGKIDGLLYHTVKFCDIYSYEYAFIKDKSPVPVLKVETDLTAQCEGQLRTRIEAFLESIGDAKGIERKKPTAKGEGGMYVMGIDSGSTSTNAVIMDEKRNLVAYYVLRTGAKAGESALKAKEEVLRKAGLEEKDIKRTVCTGYGRISIPFADSCLTEISCHGKGARYFFPTVHTIIDIGGQDSKAIRLNDEGEVAEFVMNDKCAAGTGRFLEAMARTLEVGIDELGPLSLKSTKEIEISSMCTVFAESEVISLIAEDTEQEDIARGVHKAIAGKAFSLMRRVGLNGDYMMTGGVARNAGVVKAIEEKIGAKLLISEEPDIVGAVGAALNGLEEAGF